MAKTKPKPTKSKPAKSEKSEPATPRDVVGVIPERKLRSLLKAARDCKKESAGIAGEFGQKVAHAIENDHLHRKAFSITRQLDQMTDEKLAECLLHLDHYIEVAGLADRAAKVGRLELGDDPDKGGADETLPDNVTKIGDAAARVVDQVAGGAQG